MIHVLLTILIAAAFVAAIVIEYRRRRSVRRFEKNRKEYKESRIKQ